MPLTRDTLPLDDRQEFCRALKAARERSGITLAQIAAASKIPTSKFAALERCDLRYWPKGLIRRSFFRDYVKAVGLPEAETCAEFIRLFPDEVSTSSTLVPPANDERSVESPARLSFDETWHGPRPLVLPRLLTAAIDAAAVISISLAVAWGTAFDRLAAVAVVALVYYSLSTVLFGGSPVKWLTAFRVPGKSDESAPEPADEPDSSPWITDAHRVGDADPRLRVRFKVSH